MKDKEFKSKQLKWYEKFIYYDFKIKHIKSIDNIVTDALNKKINYELKEKKTRKMFQKNETTIKLIKSMKKVNEFIK